MSQTISEASAVDGGYKLLREASGRIELNWLQAAELTGEDRKGWLQGQATNDLRSLQPGASTQFCLCSPTGQLQAICQLWWLNDRFIVTFDRHASDAWFERCEKMVIMEDVQSARAPGVLLSVQGPEATRKLAALIDLPQLDAAEIEVDGHKIVCMRSNRTGFGGWDLLIPEASNNLIAKLHTEFARIDEEAFDIARLEAGIPKMGVDTDAKTLPPELGAAFVSSHISYTKGCYTGQEILMRIFSRGHTNKTWVGIYCDEAVEPGAVVGHASAENIGKITSSASSPDFGFIASGFVSNEFAERGEVVTVQSSKGMVQAEVQVMPFLRVG